jgi:hypothetical protein
MWRVRAKLTDPSSNQRVLAANEKKHVTWYATLDGALGKFCRKQCLGSGSKALMTKNLKKKIYSW